MNKKWKLALILFCSASPALANSFLARDPCQIEFESLKVHSGGITKDMLEEEKRRLLSNMAESTERACLINYIYLPSKKNGARNRPYKDHCKGLPKKYYSDKRGRIVYRLSDQQMRQLDIKMSNDEALESCLSPLLID